MTKNKKYRYYACYKNSRGDGECIEKDSMTEAYAALKQFECYFQDDLIFIGEFYLQLNLSSRYIYLQHRLILVNIP